jgi:hypothetical protein
VATLFDNVTVTKTRAAAGNSGTSNPCPSARWLRISESRGGLDEIVLSRSLLLEADLATDARARFGRHLATGQD